MLIDGVFSSVVGHGITIRSGQLLLPDGTAAAVAVGFTTAPNTGIYRTGGGAFGISVTGTARATFDSNGITVDQVTMGLSTVDVKLARSAAGSLTFGGVGNGQLFGLKTLTELVTLVSGHATDPTTIQLPANAIIMGVSVRVTVAPATTATFTVTGTSSATAFQTGANVSAAATTTDVGTKSCPYLNTAAQTITLTYNAAPTDSLGRVRVTIHYFDITPATS